MDFLDNSINRQTILIVDDSKSSTYVLSELLKTDYDIIYVSTGEEALKVAFSNSPLDLVLLDIILPGIDGYEVCRQLQDSAQTKNIPIVFLSGQEREEDVIKGFRLGALDYITKPFIPSIVKARVKIHTELKRHRDILEKMSYLDGLTGISNRRKFDETLEFSWNLAMRQKLPISLIMLDIDFFKKYNDTYGHYAGDVCLQRIAKVFPTIVHRKTDLVARYGGEEFVCILPMTSLDFAVMLAEKIRLAICELQIPHNNSACANVVTVSVGVATLIPEDDSYTNTLIEAADKALYKSKEGGRNMVSTNN